MKWYHYIFCLLGGAFIANFFPHFVNGISGAPFPTPFANPPPPVGMSPPIVNVAWALGNFVAGFLLTKIGKFSLVNRPALIVWAVGFAAMSLMLANVFSAIPR